MFTNSSGDDSHQRRRVSRTPSPKPSFNNKSLSDQRSSPSLLSPTASLGSKTPSSPDSTVSSGSLSRSPVAENQSGNSSGGSKTSGSKSRSKSKSRSSRNQGSASSKSMHTKDGSILLKPVSSGSSVEMNGDRGAERKTSRSGLDQRVNGEMILIIKASTLMVVFIHSVLRCFLRCRVTLKSRTFD